MTRFERELKPYAEPVDEKELVEGGVYFALNFMDEGMLVPVMETVVFIGRDLEPDDVDRVYFQENGQLGTVSWVQSFVWSSSVGHHQLGSELRLTDSTHARLTGSAGTGRHGRREIRVRGRREIRNKGQSFV